MWLIRALARARRRTLQFAAMAAIPAALVAAPPVASAVCTLEVPLAPDTIPPGFDWTPLAIDWCDQLAACGFPPSDCVAIYLMASTSTIPPPPLSPPAEDSVLSGGGDYQLFACEDSEEYAAGTVSCLGYDPSAVPVLGSTGLAVLALTFVATLMFRRSRNPLSMGSSSRVSPGTDQ